MKYTKEVKITSGLIRGYIDEDYYDYISYFYPGMVSLADRDLLLSMKREIKQAYTYHIDKIENFVKELKDYMFNINFDMTGVLFGEDTVFASCDPSVLNRSDYSRKVQDIFFQMWLFQPPYYKASKGLLLL